MIIYSAHDDQIVILLNILKPDLELKQVPYASTLFFELRQLDTQECQNSEEGACYTV